MGRLFSHIRSGWRQIAIVHYRKHRIFKRLIISFCIPLAATVVIACISYSQFYRKSDQNMERYTSLLVQNIELRISDIMKDYEDIAKNIYNDNELITALMQNTLYASEGSSLGQEQYEENCAFIENLLYKTGDSNKYIVNAQLVTPSRQYHMISSRGVQRGYTIRDLESFYGSEYYSLPQEHFGYPTWIDSELHTKIFSDSRPSIPGPLGPHSGISNTITLAAAVYVPVAREFLGVLLLDIDLNAFSAAADGYGNYNDGNVFLIGRNGLLLSFNPSLSAPSVQNWEPVLDQVLVDEQSIVRTNLGGRDILVAYEKISSAEVYVVYLAELSVLLADTHQVLKLYTFLLIFILLICFILSYSVTISITSPLSALIGAMKEIGTGKWEARHQSGGHDEITILGEQFNHMAEQINELVEQVYFSEIRRQKALLSQRNAQLDALQMQINPHFLYNTLDIIRWEAMFEAHGETNATKMIEKFCSLCRMGMRIGSNTIRLSEGLEHAASYLEVINFRHQDKIQLYQSFELETDAYYVPPFILQPLIENAIVHGFQDDSRGLYIGIRCFLKEGSLFILVEDNGKGMSPEELGRLRRILQEEAMSEESIGLVNVNQRIRLFYGEPYGLSVYSTSLKGTTVEIRLPIRRESEKIEGGAEP